MAWYSHYIGDGDTSSYSEVVKSKPYEQYGVSPVKLECVGHVQKRLGTRLRELRKSYRGTKTPLTGKGKLTDKISKYSAKLLWDGNSSKSE